ncbi:hypothetical protein [Neorhizobium tomejilense]|uniref:hypothetical protein n=1 Tax=Neorhizobium tomejilense TaxID=2093828 RepID=UPI003ECFFDB3
MLRFYLFAFLWATLTTASATDLQTALDGLTKISFGRESALTIGDAVDVIDPSVPKERCVKYASDQIAEDSPGAVESKISYRFIKNIDQFENTFKLNYSVEATSSANFAKIISGESTLKNFGTFENFLKRDKGSALIVIEATALHGRDFIRDFELKDDFKALIAARNFKEFRARCGTHLVRGWNRKSSLHVIIEIDNVSEEAKIAIENTMGGSAGGTVNVADVIGASGKVSASTTIANTLRLASQVGKVSARVESVGGTGIGTLAGIVNGGNLTDPNFITNLMNAIATTAKDFTKANAPPDQFILITHPQVNAGVVEFDEVDFDKLEKIYKSLVRVDQRVELYRRYRDTDYNLWANYLRITSEKVSLLRDTLVNMYQRCRNNGDCSGMVPATIDGLILDDLLTAGNFEMQCIHSYPFEDKVNEQVLDSFNYLSSIAVIWKGKVNFLKSIELDTARVSMITPDFKMSVVPFEPNNKQRMRPESDGNSGRLYLDIYRETVDPRVVIKDNQLSLDALREIRRKVAQSVFVIRYQSLDGHDLEQTLGRPGIDRCPITDKEN